MSELGSETVEKRVFKNSRAKLVGYSLKEEEQARLEMTEEPEVVLTQRPLGLELEVDTVDGPVRYTLKPQVRTWCRDEAGQAKVRRVGFPVVPEFGGTAHAYCHWLDHRSFKFALFHKSPPSACKRHGAGEPPEGGSGGALPPQRKR